MFALLSNLFVILRKVPSAIGIIRAIHDIVGTEAVKEILRLFHESMKRIKVENPKLDTDEMSPPERLRLRRRIQIKIAQTMLGLSDRQFDTAMTACGQEFTC